MPDPRSLFARLHPLQRLAVGVWVALLLGVAGRVLFAPVRSHTVVPIYLGAAERWVGGESLYAANWPLDVYRNPPGFAAAFVPFTLLPERAAGLLWRGLSVAALLGGLAAWVRHGLYRPLTPAETGAAFALVAVPAIPSVNNGQTNTVIVGLLLFGATAAVRGWGGRAGAWLAAAAAVKVYPVAVALLVAAARPKRVGPWLVGGCVAFAAVPFALQHPGYVAAEYRNMRDSVTADDRTFADVNRAPQDLYFALRVWAVAPPPGAYLAFKLAAAAAMAGFVAFAARRTGDPRVAVPLAFDLGCVWVTLLGPATEVHTYGILGPTAAVALVTAAAGRKSAGGRARAALAAVGFTLLVFPIVRDMFPNGKPTHALGLPPVGAALVFGAVVWAGVRLVLDAPRAGGGLRATERNQACRTDPASRAA